MNTLLLVKALGTPPQTDTSGLGDTPPMAKRWERATGACFR
jgi:hypothetical protein